LIHLELGDILATEAYMDPAWPDAKRMNSASNAVVTSKSRVGTKCPDCGKMHQEIFEFKRLKGKGKGREWELIVKPVIEKWGRYVDEHVV
jgi:hypothetical protein